MKRTLIFLLFLFSAPSLISQTQTIVSDSGNVTTVTILEVVEKQSFVNNTGITFTQEENLIFAQGGTVEKNISVTTQFLPPKFSNFSKSFAIRDGEIQQIDLQKLPETMNWLALLYFVLLIFSALLVENKTRYLILFYIAFACVPGIYVFIALEDHSPGSVDTNIILEFILCIVITFIVSFILRRWIFKREQREEIIQVTP